MSETIFLYKFLPILVNFVGIIGAISSGVLVYLGLSTKNERLQSRLRMKQKIRANREKLIHSAKGSKAEAMLQEAQYPLGIDGLRYHIFYVSLIVLLVINYVLYPMLIGKQVSMWVLIILVAVYVLLMPGFKYSLFHFVVYRVIEYNLTKRNSEIFMLYDLLINEIEMMTSTRVNTYNLLRNLKPYFDVINSSFTKLLSNWGNIEGTEKALEVFAGDIDTKEANALVSVLKTLDENDRDTALKSLRGMNNIFTRSQIENYRKKRKISTELSSLPIRVTHFLILFNFMAVVIYMVILILEHAR